MERIKPVIAFVAIIYCFLPTRARSQDGCQNIVMASKTFPASDDKLIWESSKPLESFFPGEKIHVKITGNIDYKPDLKKSDKGGVLGMFKQHVEWVEHHWETPKQHPPTFAVTDGKVLRSIVNEDGSLEYDIEMLATNGLAAGNTVGAKILRDDELAGSAGPTTGKYIFQFTVNNDTRFQLIRSEMAVRLPTQGPKAGDFLQNLLGSDERIKCMKSDSLGDAILSSADGLGDADRQKALTYASTISPGNNRIVIELARTFNSVPKGCDEQKKLLEGITTLQFNPGDFTSVNNSALAFDIMADAYTRCQSSFRDPTGIDSIRKFLRSACKEYGMVYNYPKQVEMGVKYANLELDINDKEKIIESARFLEDVRFNVPVTIDSVSQAERQAFYTKFGATNHVYYRDITHELSMTLIPTLVPIDESDGPTPNERKLVRSLLTDTIFLQLKKLADSTTLVEIQYVDRFKFKKNWEAATEWRSATYRFTAKLNSENQVLEFNSVGQSPSVVSGNVISYGLDQESYPAIRSNIPRYLEGFKRLLDLPRYCPKGVVDGNGYAQHSTSFFDLKYFIKDETYGVSVKEFLPFILSKKPAAFMSASKNKKAVAALIVNTAAGNTFRDEYEYEWGVSSISFR